MNMKIVKTALAAILLICAVWIPVSAADSSIHHQIPADYTKGVPIAKPLPETEMITIFFSENWLEKNNLSSDPGIVNISIPESELKADFPFSSDHINRRVEKDIKSTDSIVMLRMPLTMFDRLNRDPSGLNVSLPTSHFFRSFANEETVDAIMSGKELAQVDNVSGSAPLNKISGNRSLLDATRLIPYGEWITLFLNDPPFLQPPYQVNYLIGQTTPYYWQHQSTGNWDIYQEREVYMDAGNDAIEIVLNYNDNSEWGTIALFPAIWDNGGQYPVPMQNWESSGGGLINIPPAGLPHSYGYHIQTGNSRYYISIEDMSTLYWYPQYVYHDLTPTYYYDRIDGSSELNVYTSFTGAIHAYTLPFRDEWNYDVNRGWLKPRTVWGNQDGPVENNFVEITTS